MNQNNNLIVLDDVLDNFKEEANRKRRKFMNNKYKTDLEFREKTKQASKKYIQEMKGGKL